MNLFLSKEGFTMIKSERIYAKTNIIISSFAIQICDVKTPAI